MKKLILSILLITVVLFINSCDNNEVKKDKKETLNTISEKIEINGVQHFIKKIGKGEPLVVLHGGPGLFHNYLVPHFKRLAKNYQIIFYDQRGCGQSEFPKDTLSINLKTYTNDLEEIRKHLKLKKMNLIGHSWGSLVALNYGKSYPNNLKRLILISPAPASSNFYDETFDNKQQKRSGADTKLLVKSMMSAAFKKRDSAIFYKTILLKERVNLFDKNKIYELYEPMVFNKTIADNFMIVNSLLQKTYFNLNIVEGIDTIKAPTLIVIGSMDNVPFSSSQLIHDNIENSKFEIINKSSHYPFFEKPVIFDSIINNFLAQKISNGKN